MKLKPIVTDTYDFPTLIRNGNVYVDKTAYLHRLVSKVDGTMFFMSRPRRFGKSLMISTLEQIFLGNRKLFRGLAISKLNYDWKKHPIIRLDMSALKANSLDEYRRILCATVAAEAARHRVSLEERHHPGWMLNQFIGKLATRNRKVVVLVDEYDAPLGGLLSDPKMLEDVRGLLHDFYITLKVRVADIRFLMMTGVSKFSKLSVFSGLNNLTDVSMDANYAGFLGYTPRELQQFFAPHIAGFAKVNGISAKKAVSELLAWYDGYRFSPRSEICVCNPISVGRALKNGRIGPYWSSTGNATLIVERLRQVKKLPTDLEGVETTESSLESCDVKSLPVISLMYQGGYLTIKDVKKDGRLVLGMPNREVAQSLGSGFLESLTSESPDEFLSVAGELRSGLESGDRSSEFIYKVLASVFAMVPHEWKLKNEAEAKRYFLLFMKMAGADITPELESSKGRADAVVTTGKAIYVFEFKCGKSAEAALRQIDENDYALPYAADRRKVVCIGLNYNAKTASFDAPLIAEAINGKVNGKVNGWISAHPGCKRMELVKAIGKSARTVDRALAELTANRLIEFRGAPKTGGYHAL